MLAAPFLAMCRAPKSGLRHGVVAQPQAVQCGHHKGKGAACGGWTPSRVMAGQALRAVTGLLLPLHTAFGMLGRLSHPKIWSTDPRMGHTAGSKYHDCGRRQANGCGC